MDIKAIIFDIDGVVVDTEGPHYRSAKQALQALDIEIDQDLYDRFLIGVGPYQAFRNILNHLFADDQESYNAAMAREDTWLHLKRSLFHEELSSDVLVFPGTFDVLQALAGKIPLAACSSLDREEIGSVMHKTGIDRFFPVIVTGGDVASPKPHPRGYQLAAEQLGLAPEQCIGIEDTTVGLQALNNAGMHSIAVTYTMPESKLAAENPDFIVDHLSDFDWTRFIS